MVQKDLELNNTSYDGPVHYFASCGLGYATAEDQDDAIRKLVGAFRSEFRNMTNNGRKRGQPGGYLWTCKVHAPSDTKYSIEFYAPKKSDVDWSEGEHHYTTYVTAKEIAYFSSFNVDDFVSVDSTGRTKK